MVRMLVHGAERSGPPIYVLRLLREWAARPVGFEPEVVVARPGPLVPQMARYAPVRVARVDRRSPERVCERLLLAGHLRGPARRLVDSAIRWRVGCSEPQLTVVNGATAPTVELLAALDPVGPVVTIAHELSTGWFANLDRDARDLLRSRSNAFLAVSDSVVELLVDRVGVPRSAVTMLHPPVDIEPDTGGAPSVGSQQPGHVLVVAGMGITDWRKAPELWLRIAARVRRHPGLEHVQFRWAGGEQLGSRASWPLEHEMDHLDLRDAVTFLGAVDDPWQALGDVSVMVSTAREDAYPLACAEAIARGIPVVGFDVDGIGEMVRSSGCGSLAPYPDDSALADEVIRVLSHPQLASTMSQRGPTWAHRELSPRSIAPLVAAWISEQVA